MTVQPDEKVAGTERWGLGRSLAVGGVAAIVLFLSAVGGLFWWELDGTWNSTPVSHIAEAGGDLEYRLYVPCHSGELRASAKESDAMVVVSAETSGEESRDSCADTVLVTLREPLGDRLVIDWATGDTVATPDHG